MLKQEYDIAIIGGGLAGLTLAIQCAEAGFAVVLFEKEQYPFHKVCGEYISKESVDFLQRMHINIHKLQLPQISKLLLTDVYGKKYHFSLPLGGIGISRYLLDNLLYEQAIRAGVDVFTQTKVNEVTFRADTHIVSTTKGDVAATVVAGCYGKRSNIDIKWKRSFVAKKPGAIDNYIGIKYHVRYNHPSDEIALFNFYNGYCGLSKIEEDKSCLCYLTTAANLKAFGNSIAQMEQQLLWKNKHIKQVFQEAEFLYQQPLAISQVSFSQKTQVEEHVLLIGDAAGMITPLCGNGMSMAMHGSVLAFNAIHDFLRKKISRESMEQQYMQTWQKQFKKRLFVGRSVQRLFGGNISTSVFLGIMSRMPAVANRLIRSTHGSSF